MSLAPVAGLSIWLLALLLSGGAAAQIVLDGRYEGLGAAEGRVLEIAPDEGGFAGSWEGPGGTQDFEADRRGDQAEAVLDISGRAHLMQATPLPFGVEVALIPFRGDGTLELDGAELFTFLREGLEVPETPERFVRAPLDARTPLAGPSFLASYEFWRPAGVRDGYLSLAPRVRTMMRLFPAVHLDVIWKLCLAPKAGQALAEALRGLAIGCDEVVAGIAAAQINGGFDAYKEEVADERDTLIDAVECGDRYPKTRSECERAAARLSEAALSLESAATVLERYR